MWTWKKQATNEKESEWNTKLSMKQLIVANQLYWFDAMRRRSSSVCVFFGRMLRIDSSWRRSESRSFWSLLNVNLLSSSLFRCSALICVSRVVSLWTLSDISWSSLQVWLGGTEKITFAQVKESCRYCCLCSISWVIGLFMNTNRPNLVKTRQFRFIF